MDQEFTAGNRDDLAGRSLRRLARAALLDELNDLTIQGTLAEAIGDLAGGLGEFIQEETPLGLPELPLDALDEPVPDFSEFLTKARELFPHKKFEEPKTHGEVANLFQRVSECFKALAAKAEGTLDDALLSDAHTGEGSLDLPLSEQPQALRKLVLRELAAAPNDALLGYPELELLQQIAKFKRAT